MNTARRKFFRDLTTVSLATGALSHWPRISLMAAEQPSEPIRLDRNENPYGPDEKAIAAIGTNARLVNRYSANERQALTKTIAKLHGVDAQQIILASGSSDIFRAAVRSARDTKGKLIVASPTFDVVSREARRIGLPIEAVPLTREYSHDLEKMLSLAHGSGGLVYICNPNNPTGSLTPRNSLEAFLNELPSTFTVLIDEAYHHYVPDTPAYVSFIDHPVNNKNVVVTRTFSKICGLAGERIGYAVAAPHVASNFPGEDLESGVSISAVVAARAILEDDQFIRRCSRLNDDDRQEFLNQINARHGHAVDPHANFIFIHAGRPAREVIDYFETKGILIGPPFPEMNTHVRVSLGLADEMKAFWNVWDSLIPAGMMHT